jgi:hypothetical protein
MSVAVFEPLTKPTAAQLNAISSSQAGLWALNGGINRELMAAVWEGSGSSWTFLHVHRWLLYDSTGQIEDPAGIEDDVSLADPPTPGELGVKDQYLRQSGRYCLSLHRMNATETCNIAANLGK